MTMVDEAAVEADADAPDERDVSDEPETDPEADTEGREKPPKDPGPPVRFRELILLFVAVLGIAGTVLFYVRWKDLDDQQAQQTEVEDAAQEFLQALFTWDGTTIDADFDRILGYATGDFEQEAQSTFNDDEIRQALRENRAGSRADELDTFVRSIEGDEARVFAVVDQTAANQEFPEGRSDTVRIEIGMTLEDGEWKVFDVNVLDGLSLGLPSVPGGDAG
jgi:Mce-associated membrane protein